MSSPEALHPALETMEPRSVASHFDMIRQTPRMSHKEAQMRAKVVDWADSKEFKYRLDAAGNIAVDVPASPGCEHLPPVLLQAHMDMVTIKKGDSTHDFEMDPIPLERDGDLLQSKGRKTTLGADDGIGMALAMAVAEEDMPHPAYTILFTADEEDTMTGAHGLGEGMVPKNIQGIINIDSEAGADKICHGSASGHTIEAEWDLRPEDRQEVSAENHTAFKIELAGLIGGHSGVDCNEYEKRGNAIRILNDVLSKMRNSIPDFLLEDFNGGQKKNSYAESASCMVYIPNEKVDEFQRLIDQAKRVIASKFSHFEGEDNEAALTAQKIDTQIIRRVLNLQVRDRLMNVLSSISDGPIKKSGSEFVTVSNNIGIVKTSDTGIRFVGFARGAVTEVARGREARQKIQQILTANGALITQIVDHGAWQEPDGSLLVEVAKQVVRDQGGEPEAFAYHAGLEVAELKDRMKALGGYNTDAMSLVAIGPKIIAAHSTRERLDIPSVKQVFALLRGMLEKLAA